MSRYPYRIPLALATLVAGLALVGPGPAWAAAPPVYKIQAIARIGEIAGAVPLPANRQFFLGPINDNGQILLDTGAANGSLSDTLLQYAGGTFTPVVLGGLDGPVGSWPVDVMIYGPGPQSMNQSDSVVFAAARTNFRTPFGTFLWDSKTQKATTVAMKGMPATGDLTFADAVGFTPVINNSSEIALVAAVTAPTGSAEASGSGVFFLGRDGRLQPVLLPGQVLPGGAKARTDNSPVPSINDTGLVAFLAHSQTVSQNSAYRWENGAITPMLAVGTDVPGAGKVHAVSNVMLNNQNRNVLVAATLEGTTGRHGLYLVGGGQTTPVAVPGQDMPEGGKFKNMQSIGGGPNGEQLSGGVSAANSAGQYAFLATLEDNSTAAYMVDAGGKLALILKSGTVTDLGKVTKVGSVTQPGLNSQGQVITVVKIDNGPETLVLLTPATP
jgi:hypothetical protein